MSVGLIDCPICGEPAWRLAVYREQYLCGDGITCHRPTREAPIRVTQMQEAHGEVLHEAKKKGVTPPNFFEIAKERVKRGDVKAYE